MALEASWRAWHYISTILISILTHEQLLEREFNHLHNDISSNPFQWSDQN